MNEKNEYILGTHEEELHRLGIQHQVWASEAQEGWRKAGFTRGDKIIDLGSGPGFCSRELAYIVGDAGKVTAIDKSEHFINHLNKINSIEKLRIETQCNDFNNIDLQRENFNGMYSRWAMAWISNPKEILTKVKDALLPKGKMVLHEYYDWSTHQFEPNLPNLNKGVAACLKSFKEQEGEIDVGRFLPTMLEEIGMKVCSIRLMPKLGRPNNLEWHWPKSFYITYFPRLIEMGYLTEETSQLALNELNKLEANKNTTLCCPLMVEIIAEKP